MYVHLSYEMGTDPDTVSAVARGVAAIASNIPDRGELVVTADQALHRLPAHPDDREWVDPLFVDKEPRPDMLTVHITERGLGNLLGQAALGGLVAVVSSRLVLGGDRYRHLTPDEVETVAAHEVAHSLGLVASSAVNADNGGYHCANPCLMQKGTCQPGALAQLVTAYQSDEHGGLCADCSSYLHAGVELV